MRYFVACLGLAVLALLATLVVAASLPAQGSSTEVNGTVNDFTTTTRDFLLVVVFLTPLQAAGEEYAFRGYLTQAFGGLFGSRALAVAAAGRCCSRSRTERRTRRSSSTGSPSASWPGSS